jgi:aminoglycoside phosphotransferase (APT) family kinase protein
VFVHGDFNTASVLFQNDSISGVTDWEFAGSGWREYDLAWALRARSRLLNTQVERDAILDGYRQRSTYHEEALRWCEALNYLHFPYWSRENEPSYTSFAFEPAMVIAGIT